MKTIHRCLLALPPVPASTSELGRHCLRIEEIATRLASAPGTATATHWVAAAAPALVHPLAGHAVARNGTPAFRADGTAAEFRAYVQYGEVLRTTLQRGDVEAFLECLVAVAARAGSDDACLRRGAIALAADGGGQSIRFPPIDGLAPRVRELAAFVATTGDRGFRALVAQAVLLNLHPLNDGNGRSARVLFNALLWPEVATPYLPLYDLRRHAPYTFEIALRCAELRGDWLPLARLHAAFLGAYERHSARAA